MSSWDAAVSELNAPVVNTFGREVLYLPEAGGQTVAGAVFQPAREAKDLVTFFLHCFTHSS